jgi:hypothetical protein
VTALAEKFRIFCIGKALITYRPTVTILVEFVDVAGFRIGVLGGIEYRIPCFPVKIVVRTSNQDGPIFVRYTGPIFALVSETLGDIDTRCVGEQQF